MHLFSHGILVARHEIKKSRVNNAVGVVDAMLVDLNRAFKFESNMETCSYKLYKKLKQLRKEMEDYQGVQRSKDTYGTKAGHGYADIEEGRNHLTRLLVTLQEVEDIYCRDMTELKKEFEVFKQLRDEEQALKKFLDTF